MTRMTVRFRLNGQPVSADVEPRMHAVDFLREAFELSSPRAGCEHGVCGACTVLLDGEPVRSCLLFAVQAQGRRLRTVEGLVKVMASTPSPVPGPAASSAPNCTPPLPDVVR